MMNDMQPSEAQDVPRSNAGSRLVSRISIVLFSLFVTVKRGTQETVLPLKEIEGQFVSFSLMEKEVRK